jgi:glycyl-tRNA synthetase alpha chain
VTERAAYIGRIRNLARAVAQSYYDSRERLGFPLAPREWVEQSTYNFEHSDVEFLFSAFASHERQAAHLMEHQLALPAYEQVLKAGHTFNLLDARGAISVTERAAYIGRIRNLAKSVAQSFLDSRARLGFPLAPKAWADEVLAQRAQKQAA